MVFILLPSFIRLASTMSDRASACFIRTGCNCEQLSAHVSPPFPRLLTSGDAAFATEEVASKGRDVQVRIPSGILTDAELSVTTAGLARDAAARHSAGHLLHTDSCLPQDDLPVILKAFIWTSGSVIGCGVASSLVSR